MSAAFADPAMLAGLDALVCVSDAHAVGAHLAAADAGRRSLPVIGFDNTPVTAALGLSSVAQPVEDAARHIIRVLAHVLAGYPGQPPAGAATAGTAAAGTAAAPEKQLLLEPQVVERIPLPLAARPRGASAKIHPDQ